MNEAITVWVMVKCTMLGYVSCVVSLIVELSFNRRIMWMRKLILNMIEIIIQMHVFIGLVSLVFRNTCKLLKYKLYRTINDE